MQKENIIENFSNILEREEENIEEKKDLYDQNKSPFSEKEKERLLKYFNLFRKDCEHIRDFLLEHADPKDLSVLLDLPDMEDIICEMGDIDIVEEKPEKENGKYVYILGSKEV